MDAGIITGQAYLDVSVHKFSITLVVLANSESGRPLRAIFLLRDETGKESTLLLSTTSKFFSTSSLIVAVINIVFRLSASRGSSQ